MAKKQSTKNQLIPAVGYLRKSTKGETTDEHGKKRERQEKSLDQQKREINELAKKHGYKIIRWYTDSGVSGWKRNGKRPGFDLMLSDARSKRDFHAILCDDLDRFSRAEVMEVFSDLSTLSTAGIHKIHLVNQGGYTLGENDIGKIIKMVVDIHGNNESSRKTGRRVALSKRNKAKEGKRSGSPAPYGMKLDGAGGLLPGETEKIKTVQWIFDQFVKHYKSMRWITSELNRKGIPGPQGSKWYTATVKFILQQSAYRGDFRFGWHPKGQFYRIDEDGEINEAGEEAIKGKPAFQMEGVYPSIVDPKVWDKAQKRFETFKEGRRPRYDSYALSRVLVCGHCGHVMYGAKLTGQKGHPVYYRCSANGKHGKGACENFQIREDQILPGILRILGEELDSLALLQLQPERPNVFRDRQEQNENRERLEAEITELQTKIYTAVENLMYAPDAEIRQIMDQKIQELKNERDAKKAELESSQPVENESPLAVDPQELIDWYDSFLRDCVRIPLDENEYIREADEAGVGNTARYVAAFDKASGKDFGMDCDKRAVNEALHSLGARIDLRWKAELVKVRKKFTLERGRFRLGQRVGELVKSETSGSPGISICGHPPGQTDRKWFAKNRPAPCGAATLSSSFDSPQTFAILS